MADTSRPAAKTASTGTSTAFVPNRSTARPTIGIEAIVARLERGEHETVELHHAQVSRTSGMIVATISDLDRDERLEQQQARPSSAPAGRGTPRARGPVGDAAVGIVSSGVTVRV